MRILLINQFFWPDGAATSQLLTDLACELAERGHQVKVVCAKSSYAGDNLAGPPPPVEIRRAFAFRFGRGAVTRVLSYGSFLITTLWHSLFAQKPDLVLTLTTPPLISAVGTLLRARGCRHWIWEMDVYPDVAVELGKIERGGWLDRLVGTVADWSRRNADGVLVLGDCMKRRLIGRGIPGHLLRVVQNWADGQQISPQPFQPEDSLRVLYSGNLGLAHDVDTVREAIRILNGESVAHFVFGGGGFHLKQLKAWSKQQGIAQIDFRGYAPRSDLSHSLGACDIGLVTQKTESLGTVVPSKVYGLMAAGRPILYIGPRGSTPHQLIERYGCGWHIDCGDASSLVDLLRSLQRNRRLIEKAGQAARHAFEASFDRPIGVARIADALDTCTYYPIGAPVREPAK